MSKDRIVEMCGKDGRYCGACKDCYEDTIYLSAYMPQDEEIGSDGGVSYPPFADR